MARVRGRRNRSALRNLEASIHQIIKDLSHSADPFRGIRKGRPRIGHGRKRLDDQWLAWARIGSARSAPASRLRSRWASLFSGSRSPPTVSRPTHSVERVVMNIFSGLAGSCGALRVGQRGTRPGCGKSGPAVAAAEVEGKRKASARAAVPRYSRPAGTAAVPDVLLGGGCSRSPDIRVA